MIEGGYEYGEIFQRKLLALLVRHPGRAKGRIEARYFTSPIQVGIARVVQETYSKHPKDRLTRTTLCELVKASLHRKARENWPLYKKEIKSLYGVKLPDKSLLLEKATEFARESRYRQALVDGEHYVNAKKYDKVHEVIDEARRSVSDQAQDATSATKLPVYHFHRLLTIEDEPEQDYLVETIVPRGGAVLSIGQPKGLKSWFSTAVALDAAIGDRKALGYFTIPHPVRTLLCSSGGPTRSDEEPSTKTARS